MATIERTALQWDYAPAPESRDAATIKPSYDLFIGGEFVAPKDGTRVQDAQPGQRGAAGRGRVRGRQGRRARRRGRPRRRVAAGPRLPPLERGKYLFRIARLIQERARELAIVESLDGGKPIRESRDVDVPLAAAHFFSYAGWADKLQYAFAGRSHTPRGVVGPGRAVELPAADGGLEARAGARDRQHRGAQAGRDDAADRAAAGRDRARRPGCPPGVVNIVTGDGAAGAALVRCGVDKVAFTGSTAVGKEIQRALAGTGTGLTLELGGKSANIVFEDAALDQAVEGIIEGIFFNQGHVCCAGSRLLLQESVAEEVVRKLWARMERLRVGDPLDKNTDVGAINSAAQLARISELVEAGEREGATRRSITCALPETGYWFPPTMFLDVAPANRITVEEIFGPVVSVMTFRTPKEAVERANNSAYGLAAGVWTDNGAKAFEVASSLRAGVVWQNTYNKFDPTAAFGGYKESGFGREGGPAGLQPYVRFS